MNGSRASSMLDIDLTAPPTPRLETVAVFADLDGTLAPIEETPDSVKPDIERRLLLDALASALSGRLAVVSGRALQDLDRVLEGAGLSPWPLSTAWCAEQRRGGLSRRPKTAA